MQHIVTTTVPVTLALECATLAASEYCFDLSERGQFAALGHRISKAAKGASRREYLRAKDTPCFTDNTVFRTPRVCRLSLPEDQRRALSVLARGALNYCWSHSDAPPQLQRAARLVDCWLRHDCAGAVRTPCGLEPVRVLSF